MKSITVLIVDDHAIFRRGLASLLNTVREFCVVGEAEDGNMAISRIDELNPDIVIMDLSMPVLDGVEATRRIRESLPSTKVLILTTFGTSVDIARAIQSGASGAFVKDSEDDELINAIRTVAAGGKAFSGEIRTMLRKEPKPPELTERQREILRSVVGGQSSDAIAATLGISADAVNQHLDAIRKKLGAANRTEAVAIALRKHLLKI